MTREVLVFELYLSNCANNDGQDLIEQEVDGRSDLVANWRQI